MQPTPNQIIHTKPRNAGGRYYKWILKLFPLILADQDVCLKQFIILIVTSAAIVSIQVTKGKRVCLGFLEEKAKQVCLLILLLNFWHYSKYIISKIGLFFMTNKNKNICSTYFTQGRGKKEGNFPLYLLVTFQALGKGWWHIPSCLLWGSNPAHQEAALILLDQEENPQWPQHQAWSACLTFHQHLNQILASSLPEANWPTLKALWLQDINEHGHSLQVLRVSFPELHAWIESTCLGGLQLFLSIGV